MRMISAFAAGLLLLAAPVRADTLGDIAKAMGADKVKTIEYSGAGMAYALGQPETPSSPWPGFRLRSYRITINYDTASMIQDAFWLPAPEPKHGGGRQPGPKGERRMSGISGDTGWSYRGRTASLSRATGDLKHTLWLSPHGVVKALQRSEPAFEKRSAGGKSYTTASFSQKGAFRATAWFDSHNMLRGVDSVVASPVYGDMPVSTTYADYKNLGGVPFPTKIKVVSAGFPTLDVTIDAVKINAPADIAPPAGMSRGGGGVRMDKVADGVWFITGGSHNSLAIEMKDHVILVETPLGDGRALAVIRAVRAAVPGKPIRYVVNTHLHFDHSGGLRAAASEGLTIVTYKDNVKFFQAAFAGRDTIRPDAYAKKKARAKFIGVGDKYVMTDGTRTVELHRLVGNLHNSGLMMVYLPKEKILSVADAFSARSMLKGPAKKVGSSTANLWENLTRLKLEVETVLPIHGRKVGFEQLKFAAGQSS